MSSQVEEEGRCLPPPTNNQDKSIGDSFSEAQDENGRTIERGVWALLRQRIRDHIFPILEVRRPPKKDSLEVKWKVMLSDAKLPIGLFSRIRLG